MKKITSPDGKILAFGMEEFKKHIVKDGDCFICGIEKEGNKFNDEHIIPDWILSRFDLHGSKVTLPNGKQTSYGKYKLKCCPECNALLGSTYEKPLSELFSKQYDSVVEHIENNGYREIFFWMALIFFKMHLKDMNHRLILDKRVPSGQIGSEHPWEDFHFLHMLVRSAYTNASIEDDVIGSVFVLKASSGPESRPFDVMTLTESQTIAIKIHDFVIIAVLNDAGISSQFQHDCLKRASDLGIALNHIQIKEVVSQLATFNQRLATRPTFTSVVDVERGSFFDISLANVSYDLAEYIPKNYGAILAALLKGEKFRIDGMSESESNAAIESGERTFIFNGATVATVNK